MTTCGVNKLVCDGVFEEPDNVVAFVNEMELNTRRDVTAAGSVIEIPCAERIEIAEARVGSTAVQYSKYCWYPGMISIIRGSEVLL